MTEENIKTQSKPPYKAMTYPVDEWGRLGGMYSLADVPVCKFVRYQELSEKDQKRLDRQYEGGALDA